MAKILKSTDARIKLIMLKVEEIASHIDNTYSEAIADTAIERLMAFVKPARDATITATEANELRAELNTWHYA